MTKRIFSLMLVLMISGLAYGLCSSNQDNPTPKETIIVKQGENGVWFDIPYRDPDGKVPPLGPFSVDINVISKPSWVTVGPLILDDPNVAVKYDEISECDGAPVLPDETLTASRRIGMQVPTDASGTYRVVVEIRDAFDAKSYFLYTIRINRVPFIGKITATEFYIALLIFIFLVRLRTGKRRGS